MNKQTNKMKTNLEEKSDYLKNTEKDFPCLSIRGEKSENKKTEFNKLLNKSAKIIDLRKKLKIAIKQLEQYQKIFDQKFNI